MGKLTALKVEKLEKVGAYSDGDGLYLRVDASGKRWFFRYTSPLDVKRKKLSLGKYHQKTNNLAQAREAAADCRKLVRQAVDPKSYRDQVLREQAKVHAEEESSKLREQMTFEVVALEWFERKKSEWRNVKHRNQNLNTLRTYVFPHIGRVPVSEVSQKDVQKCLDPIWWSKTETATRVRQRLEAVFAYAIANEYRVAANPAIYKGLLSAVYPSPDKLKKNKSIEEGKDGHFPAMAYKEAPAFYRALEGRAGMAAVALRLLILTAVRTQNVIQLKWEQLDLEKKVWNVPSGEMKGDIAFRVALSDEAVELLRNQPELADHVFVSGSRKVKPLSNGAMRSLLIRMGRSDVTVHGFRSTFRDYIGEETGFPHRVAEFALAHKIKDSAEKAYARGDLLQKRFEMMNHWSGYLLGEEA
jgi:integrase